MNRYLGVFVALIAFTAAVVTGTSRYKASALEADRELSLARIQKDYLERAGWIRSNPDEKAYKDEVNGFLRWYFREINEHLSRFHGNQQFDDYLKDLSKRVENPKELAQRKAHYDYTRKFFEQLRSGSYSPVFSATDKGMRLDVASVSVSTGQSKPEVTLGIALWGAQRELRDESTAANGITAVVRKKITTSASFNVTWKLYDDKGKLIGEMTAQGDPAMKVDYPEKYIREFPPQMVLGHYSMDLIPAEVAKIDLVFQVVSRSPSGGEVAAQFAWKMDAPAPWKLNPGEKWENAEESIRPAEDVDPRAGTKASVSSRK
jgi:hypothetical protein